METKKHKHSGDEKDNPLQSGNKTPHNNNADKSFHIRDIDLDLQDVEGIGPTTVKKLNDADIRTVMDLAVASIDQLAVDINCSKDSAALFILAAQRLLRESNVLEKEFVTADFVLEKRKSMLRCSTGSKSLDELLLGGISIHLSNSMTAKVLSVIQSLYTMQLFQLRQINNYNPVQSLDLFLWIVFVLTSFYLNSNVFLLKLLEALFRYSTSSIITPATIEQIL